MCDGFDYFTVPLTLTQLVKEFGRPAKDVTWAITVTTLCRPAGAIFFGLCSDRYGRRWTLCLNLLLIFAFELGSGFASTYHQFLGIRAAFGIIMGGTWPLAVATALENCPVEARGFVSGIVQQGYTIGYLLAAVVALTVGETSRYTWRTLYFFGGGFSLLACFARALLPESEVYRLAREEAAASGLTEKQMARNFMTETKAMLRTNWLRCLWCICVCAGFCFLAHASQDMYSHYLQTTKRLTPSLANKIVIISNCGALVGGITSGSTSQYFGRRFVIVVSILWTAAFIPLWILPQSFSGLAAGGFFMQAGVQAAWGIIPIYLSETAPPAFRALFMGLFYQLGNCASAGSAQIEAVAGGHMKLKGTDIPDYAKIQGIFVGAVLAWCMICVVFGPEADASHFEHAKVAFQAGAGTTDRRDLMERERGGHEKNVGEVEHLDHAGRQA